MERQRQHIATVYVPKNPGVRNPDHLVLRVDNFNFDAILSTIDKVGKAADKVSGAVSNAAAVVNQAGQIVQTVKDSAGNIKQIVTKPVTNTGYIAYPSGQQPLQAGFNLDNNVLLMVGGSVAAIIVALLITR